MVWFILISALSAAYTVCYAAHCCKQRRIRAAAGSFVLALPPVALIVAFVSIMLQNA